MKWIMALTAITFVGLMVFGWGMDITGRSGAQATGGEIGRVNGEPITYEEFNTVYQNIYNQVQNSGAPISPAQSRQIEDQAWNQLVMQKLINQELRARGITVTEAELRQAARFAPPQELMSNEAFQTNGQFDLNKYHQFLASPSADDQLLRQLEQYYRDVIPRSKLYYQATSATYVPDSDLWRMWRDSRETVRIRYIAFDPNTLVADDRVSVTDREIERYYREHKDEFVRPEFARIKYVALDRSANASDTAAARARALRVRQELLSGGNWAEVARRESADSGSARRSGELGNVEKGRTVPAFDKAMFSLPIGQLSEPLLTQFGFHILEVKSRTADAAVVRHVLIPIDLSEDRENALLELADSLESLGARGSIETAARALNLQVRTATIEPGIAFLPGVGQADDGALWALEDAAVGDVSDVFETRGAYYMVGLVEKSEKGTRTLQDARPAILARLMQEKKLAETRLIARKALDRIRAGGTLEQAAQAVGLQVSSAGPFTRLDFVPGLGSANAAIGAAFGLKPNQVSGTVEAQGVLAIIQTVAKTEANRAEWEAQKVEQRRRLVQAVAEQRWNLFLESLRKSAKIVDNRREVLRRGAQDTATVIF